MSLFQKLKEGATKAADKAQQTVEITRLNNQISQKWKEIDRNLFRLGQALYEAHKSGDPSAADPEIERILQENAAIEDEIFSMEARIKRMRNEKLCSCGKIAPQDANFCPNCGKKFETGDEEAVLVVEPEIVEKPRCKMCQTELEPEDRFCINCGNPQPRPIQSDEVETF
jgi:RNA polymerase subunit RPABC4/transcription elongation factor Spt4/uncharacterized coiled-coil protein SlyX